MTIPKSVAMMILMAAVSTVSAQVRHYSKGDTPSLDELRQVLMAPPQSEIGRRSGARSKAWVEEGRGDDHQDVVAATQRHQAAVVHPLVSEVDVPVGGEASRRSISIEIVFRLNSGELDERYLNALTNVAQVLIESGQSILVEGHTDASGTQEFNAALSLRRAQSVKSFLVAKGVQSSLIATRGVGASKLLDRENPLASANRRVVFSKL